MSMSEVPQQETVISPQPHIAIDENEVAEIIEGILEAQYFDASSMAPLSPASVVSISNMYVFGSEDLI